jgi:uncharacterized protein (DUF305 family)
MIQLSYLKRCRAPLILTLALTGALTVALPASGEDKPSGVSRPQATQGSHMHMAGQQGMSEGSSAIHEAMMKGMQSMQGMKMTGDTDTDFASMMIQHHQQAIAMAQAQLKHGKSNELRTQAQKIIEDSKKDIAEFEKWRDQSGVSK